MSLNEDHNHLFDSNDKEILKLRHKLKREAQSTSVPIDKIVEAGDSNMIIKEKITDSVVKFSTIKR